jgi:RNA polymerase sigma factor (sigma-70 family)
MVAYAAGQVPAFEVLYDRHARRLRAVFARTLGDAADDLVQAVFLRLHQARASFRPDRSFSVWLFTIAARLAQDEDRRRLRQEAAEQDLRAQLSSGQPPLFDSQANWLRQRFVREALRRLPASQRMVILLHRYEQYSFAEIAARLGSAESAVKLRAFRAYRRLRRELAVLLASDAALFALSR